MKKMLYVFALLCVFAGTKIVADEVASDQEESAAVVAEQVEQEEAAVFASWAQACQDNPYITGGAVGGSSLLVAALIYALKYYLWRQAEVETEIEKQAAKRDEVAAEADEQVAADAQQAEEGQVPTEGSEALFYQPCLDHPYITGGTTAGVTMLIAAIVYLLKQYLAEQIEDGVEQEVAEEIKTRMQDRCGYQALDCARLKDGVCPYEKDENGAYGCTKKRTKRVAEQLKRALGVNNVQDCPFLGLCVELMGGFGDTCPYLKEHPEVLGEKG